MRGLTITQRDALEKIRSIRDLWFAKFAELKASGTLPEEAKTASEWVNVVDLSTVHHVTRKIVSALVKKGQLEIRDTDGFGPEVRIKETPATDPYTIPENYHHEIPESW